MVIVERIGAVIWARVLSLLTIGVGGNPATEIAIVVVSAVAVWVCRSIC